MSSKERLGAVLEKILDRLDAIDDKLDALAGQIERALEEHDGRLRKLEKEASPGASST